MSTFAAGSEEAPLRLFTDVFLLTIPPFFYSFLSSNKGSSLGLSTA